MSAFDAAMRLVLKNEGGLNLDDDDPGGRTMYGIAERFHPEAWMNGPPSIGAAFDIYRRKYWNRVRGDDLPAPVAVALMDFAVQSGPSFAVRHLQGLLGVVQDGRIGPITLAAVAQEDPVTLAENLTRMRHDFLKALGQRSKAHAVRQRGYANRIERVLLAIRRGEEGQWHT